MPKILNIMEWNANGLLRHQNDLEVVLDTEGIDICLIAETHFTSHSYIKFKNYDVYHTIHPDNRARGGSAIIVRKNIKHNEETKYSTQEIQATTITIESNNQPLSVTAVYSPPRHIIKANQYCELISKQNNRFIIGGDFNAKHTYWGSRLITTKGRELFKAAQLLGCDFISTGKPTYWPTDIAKIPDLIDFFIFKNISKNYMTIKEGLDLSSDHTPTYLTLSEAIVRRETYATLINKYTDWDYFKRILGEKTNLKVPLKTTSQLEHEVDQITRDIQQAAWASTPTIKAKPISITYPQEIKELLAKKRKLRRRWHQSRAPLDKAALNRTSTLLSNAIKKIKNEKMSKLLKNLTYDTNTDHSLWKATKHLKRPATQMPPIMSSNGQWAKNNIQKARLFANHLEEVFQPNQNQGLEPDLEIVKQSEESIPLISLKEVQKEIKDNLSPKKAPGYDLITAQVLKNLPIKAILKLTNLMNASIRLKHVPAQWKVAEVIMIPKPGKKPQEVSSYRPISLLPIISKLYEKLLLKRLKPIIELKNLIPSHQFGFRNKHSTIDQVHRIVDLIEKTLEGKKVCSAVFLDVAQAFDRVWHEGLLYKLRLLLPKQYSQLLASYITKRYFRVKQEDTYSELKEIKAGVPQGSVLGPVLYLLYTSDLPTLPGNTTATFADDTAILAVGDTVLQSTAKLQQSVNQVIIWTKKWRMKLNEGKSVHVDFTYKKIQHHPPIMINSIQIPYANNAKYLGMTLDARLHWKVHVKKKVEELNIRFRNMYWLMGRRSEVSLHNKLAIYTQILKPVWTYGIQLWGCTKKSNTEKIQKFQNKVLRAATRAPWYIRNDDLHRDLKVVTVASEIPRFARTHQQRLQQHVNKEASRLLHRATTKRRLHRTTPLDLIHTKDTIG